MAKVVGYEVQKKLTSAWEPLETFGVDELREAQAAFAGYERRPPAPSIRLIEETLMDDGLFKSKTLIRKKLDNYKPPQTPNAVRPTAAARPLNKGGGGAGRKSAGDRSAKKQKKSGSLFGSLISMLFGADGAPQEQKIEGVAADIVAGKAKQSSTQKQKALPPPPEPVEKRGDLDLFDGEQELETDDLVVADATSNQFQLFFEALRTSPVMEEARKRPDYTQKVSLFTVGVLLTIEESINLFSDRGRKTVSHGLTLFLDNHDSISHFVDSMGRYLKEEGAHQAILNGSRCFRYYREGEMEKMAHVFGEHFGIFDKLEDALGGKVNVGILFTDIVDSTKMTGELGDEAAQSVVDHHERLVEELCMRFGGKKVKHLGDGLMLSFGSVERMVHCAVAVVDAMKVIPPEEAIPSYRIRCGGYFGEAIHKNADFFGSTVQLAARISSKAGDNEACFSTVTLAGDKPIYAQFAPSGTAELKGIAEPVALAKYR